MIWAYNLDALLYYLIGAFFLSYLLYQLRLLLIAYKKTRISPGNILKKLIIRCTYFTLIIIALLGPSFGGIKKELNSEGKDMYILLDISNSMMAYDVSPSRLERAKKELKYLLKNLRYNDRVGLILFAGVPYLQCPLTFDIDAVNLYLDAAKPELIPAQGSNIVEALNLAYQKQMLNLNSDKNTASKTVVLVTDGETSDNKAIDLARKMKKNNIELFVVGIGTEKGSKIPAHPGFWKDANGKLVISHLNRDMLAGIAGVNGESFYSIGKHFTEIKELLDRLNALEGSVKEVKKIDLSSNKYYYFLALALFFIFLDCLMTVNIVKI